MPKLALNHRRAGVEYLPDGRQRATFIYDVLEWVGRTKAQIEADVFIQIGTEAPGDFTGLRLIKQALQGLEPSKENGALPLIRVYEELPESAEIQVGENTVIQLEDGRK
ncbi:MAG: hypothetical protein ACREH8_07395, partial [Opitutaceae bacterium]